MKWAVFSSLQRFLSIERTCWFCWFDCWIVDVGFEDVEFPVGCTCWFAGKFWEVWEHSGIIRLNQACNVIPKDWSASYLIRTNFRGHSISRIWNTNISRAIIFAILQKMTNLGHLISRKLTKDRLGKPFLYWLITQITIDVQSLFAIT